MCNGTLFTVEKISPGAGVELSPLDQLSVDVEPRLLLGVSSVQQYKDCKEVYAQISLSKHCIPRSDSS